MRHVINTGLRISKYIASTILVTGVAASVLIKNDPKPKKPSKLQMRTNDPITAKLMTDALKDTYHTDFFLTLMYNDFKNGMFLGQYHTDGSFHELIWSNNKSQLTVILQPVADSYNVYCLLNGVKSTRVSAVAIYADIHQSITPTRENVKMSKLEYFPTTVINAIGNEAPLTAKFIADRNPKTRVTFDGVSNLVTYKVNNTISPWSVTMDGGRPDNMYIAGHCLKIGIESDSFLKYKLKVS